MDDQFRPSLHFVPDVRNHKPADKEAQQIIQNPIIQSSEVIKNDVRSETLKGYPSIAEYRRIALAHTRTSLQGLSK